MLLLYEQLPHTEREATLLFWSGRVQRAISSSDTTYMRAFPIPRLHTSAVYSLY